MYVTEAEAKKGWVLIYIFCSQPLRICYNNRIVEFLIFSIKAHYDGVRLWFVELGGWIAV